MKIDSPHYEGRDLEVLADMPKYYEWILEHFRPYLKGAAAEFGAGIGTISKRILPHVETLDLYEPSKNLVPQLEKKFQADPAVRVFSQTIEKSLQDRGEETYDVITLVNVLEHIDDDRSELENLNKLIKTDGYLLLYVPAMPGLYSRLDEYHGHFRRYTKTLLEQRLIEARFRIVDIRYMDVLGIFPWFIINTLLGKTSFNPKITSFYDTYGVPLTKSLENFFSPPCGKNLIAIARKNS
ncbi:MAG: class I SAM-dependent methyltransferase [Rhodospirillales bacterium]